MRLSNLINEEAHDVIRDYMGMGYSRSEAEAEARNRYPDEFDSPRRPQQRPQQKPSLQYMMFYNVPADSEEEARNYGIKQTKSGKWAIGVYNTSGKQTQLKIEYADKAFGPGKKWTPKTNEGYKVLPPMDDKYQPRDGLEGPFTTLSGKVVYYDPKAGKYYDSDTDMYMSYDEFQALDKDYSGMKDERDEVNEAGGYWTQPVYDLIKDHGYEKVMHELLTALDGDVINDALGRMMSGLEESVTEGSISGAIKHVKAMKAEGMGKAEAHYKAKKMGIHAKVVDDIFDNMNEAADEVHTVYINGKKWKAFYKKETADKAAATITAKGKKAEVKTGPAPQYNGSNFSAPTKRETPKTSPAMAKALKSIETSFGPERKAIGDQVIAMARTAKMLADPKWADRAWKTVEQYGIKDKADLAKELKLLIADEQRAIDADTDGHLYGADSNIKTMQRALDLL